MQKKGNKITEQREWERKERREAIEEAFKNWIASRKEKTRTRAKEGRRKIFLILEFIDHRLIQRSLIPSEQLCGLIWLFLHPRFVFAENSRKYFNVNSSLEFEAQRWSWLWRGKSKCCKFSVWADNFYETRGNQILMLFCAFSSNSAQMLFPVLWRNFKFVYRSSNKIFNGRIKLRDSSTTNYSIV